MSFWWNEKKRLWAKNITHGNKQSLIGHILIFFQFKLIHFSDFNSFIHSSSMTVMVKFKHTNVGLRKPSLITCWTLFLTLFMTFTFLILIILTLHIPKLNHLNSITHTNTLRFLYNSTTNSSSFLFCFSLFMTSLSRLFYACMQKRRRWK